MSARRPPRSGGKKKDARAPAAAAPPVSGAKRKGDYHDDGESGAEGERDLPPAKRRVTDELGGAGPRICMHCDTPQSGAGGPCAACHLFPFRTQDEPANQIVLQKMGVLPPPAASSAGSPATPAAAATPKLSAKDKELERLAAEGDDWPRFSEAERISSSEALKQGRLTYRGGHQAKLSNSLLKLIRSGRFTQLSLALPQDAAAAAAAAAAERGGHTLSVDGSGHISARVALKDRPLLHMNELMLVFFTAILPALFDRPRALLDWAGLMRTAVALNRGHGWPVARDYVVAALNDCVPQREPFHDFRARLLEEYWMQPAGGLGASPPQMTVTPQQQQQYGAPTECDADLSAQQHGDHPSRA
jgi:hypothetical protein